MPGQDPHATRRGMNLRALWDWPIIWGAGATVGFYYALPHLPRYRALAERYFCGHPIEYATTALFFVGMALLVRNALGRIREGRALACVITEAADQHERQCRPRQLFDTLPASWQETIIGERLRDAANYTESNQSAGVGEHLKYLAELAAERLHGSYAMIRTITWAIPILGFLGTVMGITLAIANIDPAQLGTSLSEVTSGLAIAFDTTALALALSLVLVFATFLVERSEQRLLDGVEAFALRGLMAGGAPASPLAEAEQRAAGELIERTDGLIRSQTDAWQAALETMRARWSETIREQQEHLADSLTTGMNMTLESHRDGLAEAREELVSAVAGCTDRLERTLNATNHERARQLEALSADLRGLWDRCRGDLDDMQERYSHSVSKTVDSVGHDLAAFREDLRETKEMASDQHHELIRQGDQLVRIAESSGDLQSIQHRLHENLDTLRSAETMQDAAQSLTAAAHLLSARTSPRSRAA